MKAKSRSRDVRIKPKAETEESDCVLIYTSVCNGRVSRRPRGSAPNGQNTGKLGSAKFEIHIEYDCSLKFSMELI